MPLFNGNGHMSQRQDDTFRRSIRTQPAWPTTKGQSSPAAYARRPSSVATVAYVGPCVRHAVRRVVANRSRMLLGEPDSAIELVRCSADLPPRCVSTAASPGRTPPPARPLGPAQPHTADRRRPYPFAGERRERLVGGRKRTPSRDRTTPVGGHRRRRITKPTMTRSGCVPQCQAIARSERSPQQPPVLYHCPFRRDRH